MSLDLRALLQESEPAPEQAAQPEPIDLLADKPLHLSLTLSPSPTLDGRLIQGTLGEPGQMPIFIQEPVTIAGFSRMLEVLYAAYAEAAKTRAETEASQTKEVVDSAENTGQVRAAVKVKPTPTALDIF